MGETQGGPEDIRPQLIEAEADILRNSIRVLEHRLASRPVSGLTRFILESTIRDAKTRLEELEQNQL